MSTFKLSAMAKADLVQVARYTEKRWGRNQRNHYLKMLDDAFHLVASKPSIGKPCDFIKQGYRRY